ncbi:MAG TPA: hypothetical protein VGZ25_03535, partial [Gemmataceae bacterium]|nr:hypothetical protein [Gemmataceae bacterium]
ALLGALTRPCSPLPKEQYPRQHNPGDQNDTRDNEPMWSNDADLFALFDFLFMLMFLMLFAFFLVMLVVLLVMIHRRNPSSRLA